MSSFSKKILEVKASINLENTSKGFLQNISKIKSKHQFKASRKGYQSISYNIDQALVRNVKASSGKLTKHQLKMLAKNLLNFLSNCQLKMLSSKNVNSKVIKASVYQHVSDIALII